LPPHAQNSGQATSTVLSILSGAGR